MSGEWKNLAPGAAYRLECGDGETRVVVMALSNGKKAGATSYCPVFLCNTGYDKSCYIPNVVRNSDLVAWGADLIGRGGTIHYLGNLTTYFEGVYDETR